MPLFVQYWGKIPRRKDKNTDKMHQIYTFKQKSPAQGGAF